MKKVVLIIGHIDQPNVCGFLKEFESLGGVPEAIVCIRPVKGLKYYLKAPFRLVRKWGLTNPKRLISGFVRLLTSKQYLTTLVNQWNNNGENSWDLLDQRFNIRNYAQQREIPFYFRTNLSETTIRSLSIPGEVIYPMYAGGIISKSMLGIETAEFVNAHMGEMPRYRGMNVLEWAVLEGNAPKVSVMVMNEAIDGGDVIWTKSITLSQEKSIAELRRTGYEHCYQAMAEGIYNYQRNSELRKQQPGKGVRYYYRMHNKIRDLLELKLGKPA